MQAGLGWFRFLKTQEQYEIADKYIKLLNIATPSADQQVKNLSGGNQQKVILARWLATNPRLLILDEPTRGIDVGAKAEIQKLVLSLAEQGKSCVFISSELEEVLRTSHRVAVMREHKMVAEFTDESGDQDYASDCGKLIVTSMESFHKSQQGHECENMILGIEFGSTRIKAVLIDQNHEPVVSGSHEWENQYVNDFWTYSLESIWGGLQDCYSKLADAFKQKYQRPYKNSLCHWF